MRANKIFLRTNLPSLSSSFSWSSSSADFVSLNVPSLASFIAPKIVGRHSPFLRFPPSFAAKNGWRQTLRSPPTAPRSLHTTVRSLVRTCWCCVVVLLLCCYCVVVRMRMRMRVNVRSLVRTCWCWCCECENVCVKLFIIKNKDKIK